MNKMKNFFRMASLLLLALTAQTAVHAWVPEDLTGPIPGYMKAGITVYDKNNPSVVLPYVTMRFNVVTSEGTAYYYLTSDATGFAYLEVPMTDNGVISDGTSNFNLRDLAGSAGTYRVDTDPIDEWAWGTVGSGFNTRWFLTGHHAVKMEQYGGGGYSHDNARLNVQDTDGNGRYDWQDEGCSFHFACYVLSTASQHDVTFDLTSVGNPSDFANRTVAHGSSFTTRTPQHVNPDWKFRAWGVCSPTHPKSTVAAPDGALTVTVNQTIQLTPLWKYEPDEPPPTDDPIVQFCQETESNMLKVAMKVFDWTNPTVPLRNVTVGLGFTIPDPNNPNSQVRRTNVVTATTDADGVLKMLIPVESDGYIVVNGVKSTEINLNTVTQIDCDPAADVNGTKIVGWDWDVSSPGRVRNWSYGVNTERVSKGTHDNASVTKVDRNLNNVWDYIENGASLYFECFLKNNDNRDRAVYYNTDTIQNKSAFPNTICHCGDSYVPKTEPLPVNAAASGRTFLGWKCLPLSAGHRQVGEAFDFGESLTVNEDLMLVPVWGANPDAEYKIKFQVYMWDHGRYWDNQSQWQSNPDVLGPPFGQTTIPVNGLTFVLKSYDHIYNTTLPDSVKVPVGQPNTPQGWADSRVEVNFTRDENGGVVWESVYEIPRANIQYLKEGWIIDTDPDEKDLAVIDRGKGWGPETLTFDWDWFIKKDDREGAGLVGVRVIPECSKHEGGIYPAGLNRNDVIQLNDDMIANGFEFTFKCYVVPAIVVDYDTDGGRPAAYPEERFPPSDSCPFWQQRFVAENPGSPTRGADERFEGWYEVLSTDVNGNDTLASAPWRFDTAVTHSMTLKAVYRKTRYDVTTTPARIEVTGPGTLTFREILSNPDADERTYLTVTVDGGEPVQVLTSTTDATKTVVFGGEVDIKHVVEVSFTTTQTETGTLGTASVDGIQWVPYNTGIADPVTDRASEKFEVQNLGTAPGQEREGVTFFDGVSKTTTSTVNDAGRQTASVVNPAGGATDSTTGTEDYWYRNYDGQQNQLATVDQAFAETPPTLSVGEETSFQVTGITGGSVIRWEALVTPGETGSATPSELTVTVTFTTEDNVTTTETKTYRASDFENGQFEPEWLDYRTLPVSTSITLDFTYKNTSGGRAYVDNIYWKCAPTGPKGMALMIVDHEDADADHVYLAFQPQYAPGVDRQTWLNDLKNGKLDVCVKTATQRAGVGDTTPVKIELSKNHESTTDKVWVKVPIDVSKSGEYSQIFLGGEPIAYKRKDGTMTDTSKDGSGATSVNTFGDLKVSATTANTMVAVPWTWYSDQEQDAEPIPANKLVKTTNLTAGDMLYAYSGSAVDSEGRFGVYLGWTVAENQTGNGLHWEAIQTVTSGEEAVVGGNAKVFAPDASATPRLRGTGVWLVRQDPTKPFWLYGQSVTTSATTTIAAPGENEDACSTMLGNPFAQSVRINDLEFVGGIDDADTIVVPNGTDAPNYLYRKENPSSGKKEWVWVHVVKSSSGRPKNAYDWNVTIPPGLAFWYVRRGAGNLYVTWQPPASVSGE